MSTGTHPRPDRPLRGALQSIHLEAEISRAWALRASGALNANPVRFEAECGVGEHVNDEVDVILLGIAGSRFVKVNGEEHPVSSGTMTFSPNVARRSTRSTHIRRPSLSHRSPPSGSAADQRL